MSDKLQLDSQGNSIGKLEDNLSGDILSFNPLSRRVCQKIFYCQTCEKSVTFNIGSKKEQLQAEYGALSCPDCGNSFGSTVRLKQGWIYEKIAPNFDAGRASVPQAMLPPSLKGYKVQ